LTPLLSIFFHYNPLEVHCGPPAARNGPRYALQAEAVINRKSSLRIGARSRGRAAQAGAARLPAGGPRRLGSFRETYR